MKKGTYEIMIRTERKKDDSKNEYFETERWSKVRGYKADETFDPELEDSDLVKKVKQEQMRTMMRDSTINKYESKIVYTLPSEEKDNEEKKETEKKDTQKKLNYSEE